MKLAISNIAWTSENDREIYQFLSEHQFSGLEIAPSRIFSTNPYEHIIEAQEFANYLKKQYNLEICSMQSILYGKTENIFSSDEERENLISYTKKAINFAQAINCSNLVFGCPKNRILNSSEKLFLAEDFFIQLANYAQEHDVVISMEAIPRIYGTNFINTTNEAFNFCQKINKKNFNVNVDLGTMIYNNEDYNIIYKNINFINHIHISEPKLMPIKEREIHKKLKNLPYRKYFSIEMKNFNNLQAVKKAIVYIEGLFQ